MVVRDITSVAIALIVLAGLAVALKPGSQTQGILGSASNGFSGLIRTASGG